MTIDEISINEIVLISIFMVFGLAIAYIFFRKNFAACVLLINMLIILAYSCNVISDEIAIINSLILMSILYITIKKRDNYE